MRTAQTGHMIASDPTHSVSCKPGAVHIWVLMVVWGGIIGHGPGLGLKACA
jgi:hypothetical protein